MANKIKGIIVEIGGDTVGLQKALKDVNDKAKNVSSEMREVEKASNSPVRSSAQAPRCCLMRSPPPPAKGPPTHPDPFREAGAEGTAREGAKQGGASS